jgi:hypothetical protein
MNDIFFKKKTPINDISSLDHYHHIWTCGQYLDNLTRHIGFTVG